MAVPAASSHEVKERRRPRVEVQVTRADHDPHGWRDREGVELTLTRAGVEIAGFYDSFVGIQGFSLTWAEFDALRARLA